jgi:hypothetical protein
MKNERIKGENKGCWLWITVGLMALARAAATAAEGLGRVADRQGPNYLGRDLFLSLFPDAPFFEW